MVGFFLFLLFLVFRVPSRLGTPGHMPGSSVSLWMSVAASFGSQCSGLRADMKCVSAATLPCPRGGTNGSRMIHGWGDSLHRGAPGMCALPGGPGRALWGESGLSSPPRSRSPREPCCGSLGNKKASSHVRDDLCWSSPFLTKPDALLLNTSFILNGSVAEAWQKQHSPHPLCHPHPPPSQHLMFLRS